MSEQERRSGRPCRRERHDAGRRRRGRTVRRLPVGGTGGTSASPAAAARGRGFARSRRPSSPSGVRPNGGDDELLRVRGAASGAVDDLQVGRRTRWHIRRGTYSRSGADTRRACAKSGPWWSAQFPVGSALRAGPEARPQPVCGGRPAPPAITGPSRTGPRDRKLGRPPRSGLLCPAPRRPRCRPVTVPEASGAIDAVSLA